MLRELRDAGCHVPDFFVLSFPSQNIREFSVGENCSAAAGNSNVTRSSADHLRQITTQLGFPLAVRSSASVEDGPRASFAGQFRSSLNLNSIEEVELAVQDCLNSASSPSVSEYCRRYGIAPESIRMQIIIQKMLQPQLAGVIFTVNPVSGREEVVIDACAGLADELLAGRESALPKNHVLIERHRDDLTSVAQRIAQYLGQPQDIEFAIQEGTIFILQSRPVTRINTGGIDGEWTNANFRDGGVSSSVCSPLMWSLYSLVWNASLKDTLREIQLLTGDFPAGRMMYGRPYWNLGALKNCLTRVPGFVEREFDTDVGVEIRYEGDGIRTAPTLKRFLRFLPCVMAIRRFVKQQTATATRILQRGYGPIDQSCQAAYDDATGGFRSLIERDYFQLEYSYFRTIFALSLAKMDFKLFFPQADFPALMTSLPPVRHTAPLRRMQASRRSGNDLVQELINEFRHHYHIGLDICHARWDEVPDYVSSLIQREPSHDDESEPVDWQQVRRETAAGLPFWKRRLFYHKLDRLRYLIWLREEMRDLSNRMYYGIRRHVLAVSKKCSLGDDIFFMTYQEILNDDRSSIDHNRIVYDSYRNFRAPNEIGERFTRPHPPESTAERPGQLKGLAAGPGTVQGTAHVARTIQEALQLPTGSILICPYTDPGWTIALSRVSGLVTEAGGILSHAAVLCREFGIPAVLAVPDACDRIASGSQIEIHGDKGSIELLPESQSP